MTSYEPIFDLFKEKIIQDTDFFMYDVPEMETNIIIKQRCLGLMNQGIDYILSKCVPYVDFNDRNDTLEQFNLDLVEKEQELIAESMYFCYMSEDTVRLKAFVNRFSDKDIQSFSPANERNSYMDMIEKLERQLVKKIKSYVARDRLTGKLKPMPYTEM